MIDRNSPVTEDELHAYVDGELPAKRHSAVEAWLASHPEQAARVAEWRAQADAIRARYGAIAAQPPAARFDLDRLTRSRRWWRVAAAAVLLATFAAGGAAGWLAHGASVAGPTPFESFTVEALTAHRLYIAEVRHPIEVKAGEQHLLPWLSRRVGTTLRAPDLGEFSLKLLGGRLLPGPLGPAALLMYESPAGERYTFYCSKSPAPRTALRYHAIEGVAAVQWVESDIGFVMSGPADRDRLLKIAQTAYEQMESRPPPTRASELQLISRRGS
jgi:anti-sigma factor RsiW